LRCVTFADVNSIAAGLAQAATQARSRCTWRHRSQYLRLNNDSGRTVVR
jgi:hypothetical protein